MEKGGCLPLFLILYKGLDGLLPLEGQEVLLVAGRLLLQHLLVQKEFLPPVLLEVVIVGLVLGVGLFDCIK